MSLHTVTQNYKITKSQREILHGHKAYLLWFTGLSGSGKSTLANLVEIELYKKGLSTYILDGDNVRQGINKDLSFTPQDRSENIRRIAEISLATCESRDVKGLYKKARAGEIKNMTGISAPYQAPTHPDLEIITDGQTIQQSVAVIMQFLNTKFN